MVLRGPSTCCRSQPGASSGVLGLPGVARRYTSWTISPAISRSFVSSSDAARRPFVHYDERGAGGCRPGLRVSTSRTRATIDLDSAAWTRTDASRVLCGVRGARGRAAARDALFSSIHRGTRRTRSDSRDAVADGGEWLFRVDEPPDCPHVVGSGRLRVVAGGANGERSRRRAWCAARRAEVLTASSRSASVQAVRDSVVAVLEAERFSSLSPRTPSFAVTLARSFARQLQQSGGQLQPPGVGSRVHDRQLGTARVVEPVLRRLEAEFAAFGSTCGVARPTSAPTPAQPSRRRSEEPLRAALRRRRRRGALARVRTPAVRTGFSPSRTAGGRMVRPRKRVAALERRSSATPPRTAMRTGSEVSRVPFP